MINESEAQEFLKAMGADAWEPPPTEWYEATVASSSIKRRHLHLRMSNGADVFCVTPNIMHTVGGHSLCAKVPKGTPAVVRVERRLNNKRDNRSKNGFFALECKLQGNEPIKKVRETLVIQSWSKGRIGTGIRECGCPIFTVSECDLREGDIVEADIFPSNRRPGTAMARVVSVKNGEGRESDGRDSVSDCRA